MEINLNLSAHETAEITLPPPPNQVKFNENFI